MALILSGDGSITGNPDITLTESVSIAGTVTYEDVTNIDSVGIITARSGINVTGGNVGIGTDNVTANFRLDVSGDLSIGESNGTDNTFIDQKQNGSFDIINSGRPANNGRIRINRTNSISGDTTYFRDFEVFDGKGTLLLQVDGSEGNVGIKTDSTSHPLEVHSSGATNIVAKSTNGNGGFLNYSGLSNTGTTTFSVNHNGMIYTAGGLNFGTVASPVTSQTLDDYEEGSFDPSFTSTGGTLTSNNTALNYVKVGRMVTIAGRILINTATTPTGTVTITLPFAFTATPTTGSGNPYITHGLAYLHGPSFPANYQRAFWELSSPTNKAALYFERDGQGWSTFDGQNFSSNQYVTVNITYFTDL